ncbi:MAG: hypothetical protein ACPGOV_14615 [Magnetovibrionaceae bacterium]
MSRRTIGFGLISLLALTGCGEDVPMEPELCAFALFQALGTPEPFTVDQSYFSGGSKESKRVRVRVVAVLAEGRAEGTCLFERRERSTFFKGFSVNGRTIEGEGLKALTAMVDRKKWDLAMQ